MMKEMSRMKMRTQSLNHSSPDNSKSSSRMQMSRQMTRIANSLDFLNSSLKINSRENPKKLDKAATLRPVQIAMGVKGMDT